MWGALVWVVELELLLMRRGLEGRIREKVVGLGLGEVQSSLSARVVSEPSGGEKGGGAVVEVVVAVVVGAWLGEREMSWLL